MMLKRNEKVKAVAELARAVAWVECAANRLLSEKELKDELEACTHALGVAITAISNAWVKENQKEKSPKKKSTKKKRRRTTK